MGLGQIGTGPSPTMRNALFWPLLALTGLLAYLPALRSFFVKDDLILILSAQAAFPNLLIHSWPGGFFRPSAELLFAIQHALFGLHPLPYHLLSLAAHAAATLLLYRLFLRLLENRDLSRIGALVFALHPLHTESVSWISGQMSLFAGLCTLLLLYEPGRGHSAPARHTRPDRHRGPGLLRELRCRTDPLAIPLLLYATHTAAISPHPFYGHCPARDSNYKHLPLLAL
jgi:hypothetical protein